MRITAFKDKLSALMKAKSESNYALAKALDVSNSTVANWLNGETEPIRSHIKLLADHYGVAVEELLKEES